MNHSNKGSAGLFAVAITAIVLSVVAIFIGSSKEAQAPSTNVGSVTRGGEYQSTTTSQAGFADKKMTLIDNRACTLGSVIISSTTPATPVTGTLRIMNASSTTDVSSTTLASFPILPTQGGQYVFDSVAPRGCIVEGGTGFNGTYTITYR